MIKIALAQINPIVGDLKKNSVKIIAFIRKAKKKGVDLVIFPELALTGYPPEDLLLKNHFIVKNKQALSDIKKECKGIDVLIGFVDGKGDAIYNSCALIRNSKIESIYHKSILPNYGVFDEKRYFSSGNKLVLYTIKGYTFAVSICEDIWEENFINCLREKSPDFVINISASPFHLGKVSIREKILSHAAKRIRSFVFYCNLVGGQDELVFDGTSKIISPSGKLIAVAKRFLEDLFIFNFDKEKKYSFKKVIVDEAQEAFLALRLGLSDYVRKNGFKKVVVGVSGGIDSAVVIALAKEALGSENVYGLLMPSLYTSKDTLYDAKKICKNLGIKHSVVEINNALQTYLKDLKPYLGSSKKHKTEENLQARIRGNILMAFSNRFGYLVLNTGNKSEVSCGYCTLYGDMVGGFGILSDVYKMLVYNIARYINKINSKNIIPIATIKRAPSAELKFDQKDTDSLPPYELLDPILKLYVEEHHSLDQIIKKG
ncbi:MAG: NAD+ synthase, partial [Candidatus Omnitrophica bacterium]|nr:NAD+ synthase [Candidatus Omnitrophota bacterium]